MGMKMRVTANRLIEERGVQLAIVYFSRRNDLLVTQPREFDYGVDILVSITQHGQVTGRLFGVEIKASRDLQVKPINSSKNEYKVKVAPPKMLRDLPFPI